MAIVATLGAVATLASPLIGQAMVEPGNADPRTTVQARSVLVSFALDRFESQGLDLGEVRIEFRPSPTHCNGNTGYYRIETGIVTMCSRDLKTLFHELAHHWAYSNLSAEEMDAFSDSMGLSSWNDQTQPWHRRGTEQAAEIIAWALMERAPTIRFIEEGSLKSVFQLLTIPDATALDLYHGFVKLTGMEPRFRSAFDWDPELIETEWQETMGAHTSPELARAGGDPSVRS
jgi:hypothetical protein